MAIIKPYADNRDPKFRDMEIKVPQESVPFIEAVLRHTSLIRHSDLETIGKIYREYTKRLLEESKQQ